MKVAGVLFDVDGTLLDTERVYMHAWKLAAAEAGFDLCQEALRRTRAIDKRDAEKIFRSYCGEGFHYDDIYRRRVEIAEQLFYIMDPESLFKPGALELLKYLDERGIKKALATGTGALHAYPHLEYVGLLDPSLCGKYPMPRKPESAETRPKFSTVVTGDEVSYGKPAPEIFLTAASRLGVAPEECIVMEDSYAGIRAGKAAGATVFMIPDQAPYRPEDAPFIAKKLDSLREAPSAIDAFLESSEKGPAK